MFSGGIAFGHLFAGRYADALEWSERSLDENPRYIPLLRLKLVASVHLGRVEEGRKLLRDVLRLQPRLTIAGLKAHLGMTVTPEIFAMRVEGFRKAGLPEE